MTRPTPATIDRMLQVAEREAHPTSCAGVLAAEVRALRIDLQLARDATAYMREERDDLGERWGKAAAENERLLEALEEAKDPHMSTLKQWAVAFSDPQLRATLARVEAVVPASCIRADDYGRLVRDLRAALRGPQ